MKQSQKIQQVKQQAKRMSERLRKMGFEVSPRQALELVAAERGFVTWNAYEAELRKPEPKAPAWSKKHGPMSQAEYLRRRELANICPVCGSDNIEGDFVEIDGKFALQECSCNKCDSVWVDRYVADLYELDVNGLGTGAPVVASTKAYGIAAYGEGRVFLAKGTAFGKDPAEATATFVRLRLGGHGQDAEFVVEFLGEVCATAEALVTWWQDNNIEEDGLDELVYESVQEHGLPQLNEQVSEEGQEAYLEDREAQASNINNGGVGAQLQYLASVLEPGILLTTLANEIGLEGIPPAV